MAVGSWQFAVGSGQWAVGSGQWAVAAWPRGRCLPNNILFASDNTLSVLDGGPEPGANSQLPTPNSQLTTRPGSLSWHLAAAASAVTGLECPSSRLSAAVCWLHSRCEAMQREGWRGRDKAGSAGGGVPAISRRLSHTAAGKKAFRLLRNRTSCDALRTECDERRWLSRGTACARGWSQTDRSTELAHL